MLTKNVDIKLGGLLIIGFILFTAIGTVTHEMGHYTCARLLGYKAQLHYGSSGAYNKANNDYINTIYKRYRNEIDSGLYFPEMEAFHKMQNKQSHDSLIIISGGPLQTMLTGTIGLILLYWYRKRFYSAEKLNFRQWLIIFITLFWLREVFNFVDAAILFFLKGYYPGRSDEIRLAVNLGLNKLSITLPAAIIASIVLAIVIFKFIPAKQRLTFILSGLIGGLLGFYLWLYLIGPIVMP